MKTKQELYKKVMHYAHLLEDRLAYDETEEGKRWGKLVNELQNFKFDGEIPITYGLIKATCGWSKFAEICDKNIYAVNEFGDYPTNEVFYITESQYKQLNKQKFCKTTLMTINYDKLDSDYITVRENIIAFIKDTYNLDTETAIGIVDYENDDCEEGEAQYNQVKDLMEQDLLKERQYIISSMAKQIMKNDEGQYQQKLKKQLNK